MEKSQSNDGQGPANEQSAALPTLVSLDSMDWFGVPGMSIQQETLDSIYNKYVAPQKNGLAPAREESRNVHVRTPGGATSVGSKEQHHGQKSITNPISSQDAPTAGGGITSSPKHVPVWQQQRAWRQGSQAAVAKSPTSAAQVTKANASHRGHQRKSSQHSVLARRPCESSLKMKAHMDATAGQQKREAGRISRAGSVSAAVHMCAQVPASDTLNHRQLQDISAAQATG